MKETVTTKCPNCGENLTITVSNNGKQAENTCTCGTYVLPNKADERIAALKKAGVDTSNLFAMQNASGIGMVVRLVNGIPTTVEDDDPIYAAIIKGGTVPDRRLFRRWVMSQMFHMMTAKNYREKTPMGFTKALHNKGYEYQWKMVVEEMRVQAKLYAKDYENFVKRNRWFDKKVLGAMCDSYISTLKEWCACHQYKKGAVVGVWYGNAFVAAVSLHPVVYTPLDRAAYNVKHAQTPKALYEAIRKFNDLRERMPYNTPQIKEWIDAYKGAGAYYTAENLIRFHGCLMRDSKGRIMSQGNSLILLNSKADEYCGGNGWRMFALMKKLMNDNKVDIEAKFKEWANKR